MYIEDHLRARNFLCAGAKLGILRLFSPVRMGRTLGPEDTSVI